MRRSGRSFVHRRTFRLLVGILVVAVILMNVAGFLHARAMTTFVQSGERTGRPENLSLVQQIWVMLTGVKLPRPENVRTPAEYQLPFTTDTIISRDSTSLELWLIEQPQSRKTIAIFHGYGASKDDLLEEAAVLFSMGYSVCLADFRGSGGSGGHHTTIGWEEADDVIAVAQYLRGRRPNQSLWLYGESMGGAAVLRAVSQERGLADGLIIEAVYDRLINTTKRRFEMMHVPAFPFAYLLVFWGGVQLGFDAFDLNPVEYAQEVSLPTLMLHGELDPRTTVADAQSVYDQLAGDKLFEVFGGIGHQSCLDADSMKWQRVVGEFLEKQRP